MSETKVVKKVAKITEEEAELLRRFREAKESAPVEAAPSSVESNMKALTDAFAEALERTKPKAKITVANRKAQTPWTPPEGEPMVKLKRKYFHHSLPIEEKLSNKEKTLLNAVRPGRYCDGHVIVKLRKDRGIDIDYPVRTNVQRLKLVNTFGIRSFTELLERVIDEKTYPAKYRRPEDKDLYDLDE